LFCFIEIGIVWAPAAFVTIIYRPTSLKAGSTSRVELQTMLGLMGYDYDYDGRKS
jgi:hypothetical protein